MIRISDLRRIKKICFDRIFKNSTDKKYSCVLFSPINEKMYQIIMTNDSNYARLVAELTEMSALPEFQISWLDFSNLCEMFDKQADVTVKNNVVTFKENKTKMRCMKVNGDANKQCSFKFDFENAFKISMDNTYIVDNVKTVYGGVFCVSEDNLASTDNCIACINKINCNVGDKVYRFITKFPSGMWYFNPDSRLIVSEDKKIACTIDKAILDFPYAQIVKMSKAPLSNYAEFDMKQFDYLLQHCSKIKDEVRIEFKEDKLILSAATDLAEFLSELPCKYDHPTQKDHLTFQQKYIRQFLRCAGKDNKIKLLFDDYVDSKIIRAENKTITVFAIALNK